MSETTWADEMDHAQFDRMGQDIQGQGFDHVFQVTAEGVVGGPEGFRAPEGVEHDDEADILIDGVPHIESTSPWVPLRGCTNQDRYNGAIMHASEFIGGGLARAIIERSAEWEADGTPLLWAVTSVEVPGDPDHPAGWAIWHREMEERK